MSNFRQQIYNLISEQLGVEIEKLTPEAHFAEDLNAGNLEMEELVAHIEEKLNIELDAERAKNIQTVDDLVHLVFDKLNGLLDED
jgi:acyl carrier protein